MALRMDAGELFSSFRISITQTTSETDLTIISLTDDQIAASHRLIAGKDTPFSNTAGQMINTFKLDLTDAIPKFGNVNFRSDCYVIGIHFLTTPVAAGFHLYKFQVDGSALVVA